MASPPPPTPSRLERIAAWAIRRVGLIIAGVVVLFVLVVSLRAYSRADAAYHARDTANSQKQHAQTQATHAQAQATKAGQAAQAVATDVNTLCDELKRLHHPCPVQSPDKVIKSITGQSGVPGSPGPSGAPGRGIVHTTIDSTGHLLVSYSDGSVVDAGIARGAVGGTGKTGPAGPSGVAGSNGRGISSTSISSGSLIVAYTDGTTRNLGSIIGPKGADGRGVAGAIIDSDGNLVIAYTDGTSQNLGDVIGPKGDKGDTGAAGRGIQTTSYDSGAGVLTITYTDGTQDQFHIKGDQGPPGPQGAKGDKGDPGSPGPSCPDGFHQTAEPNPANPAELWAVCAMPSPTPTP